jgi:hypothetical protein
MINEKKGGYKLYLRETDCEVEKWMEVAQVLLLCAQLS